ncbi:hypothetical protein ABLO26_25620 [Neobacillus sp. 179-J 1A1 HS]|uniref:hypothetical protein n=1 Tax=Neobacillus driksii TaxID=3035913 RepID=UPI0035BBDDFB
MHRTCKCGEIVEIALPHNCPKERKYTPRSFGSDERSLSSKVTSTTRWRKVRDYVRYRDKVCLFCKDPKYFNHTGKYNVNNLQVHHIHKVRDSEGVNDPINYDPYNLILVCKEIHHDMCESGEIHKEVQLEKAREQEDRYVNEQVWC